MSMDLQRDPAILRRKKIRRAVLLGIAGLVIIVISVAVSRLQPAAPSIQRATIWPDTVKRGPMVREVRGADESIAMTVQEPDRDGALEEWSGRFDGGGVRGQPLAAP